MATIGNNFSKKREHVRESFFDSDEKEFAEELLKDPKEKNLHNKLLQEDVEKLYKKACDLISRVERGEIPESKIEEIEKTIVHCLMAIEDIERVLELELTL